MGDMGDFWKDVKPKLKKDSVKRKNRNLENAINIMDKNNILYKSYTDVHYLVENIFDYYPTTGLFINRNDKRKGRGVHSLLRAIKREKNNE